MLSWWERVFFSFFCTLARIIPEAFEQSVRVDRHWEWEQDGPSGPQQPGRFGSEITVRLMSPFFFVLVWRMEGHVDYWLYMCCEKIWQKWLIKQGCLRCHYLKAPHKHTVTVIAHFQILCSFRKPTNQKPIFSFQVKTDAFWTGQMFQMCFLLQAFTSYKFLKVKDFNTSLYLLLTWPW